MSERKTTKKKDKSQRFSKLGLINSKYFSIPDKDILNIVLFDGEKYTLKEAEKEIEKFKEGLYNGRDMEVSE